MALPLESPAFKDALVILGAAGLVIPAFHRLRVSPVVGFIAVGMIAGPAGLGALTVQFPWLAYVTIGDRAAIAPVAELGIALLLFMIGLELSFERLKVMRHLLLGLGAAQLFLSWAAIGGGLWLLGVPPEAAAALGAALALSSTAVVMQLLSQEGRLTSGVGRAAFAILLFQDIMLVPILFLIAAADTGTTFDLAAFETTILKGIAAIAALLLFGRFALRPMLHRAAMTRSPELFMAAALAIGIGASAITAAVGLGVTVGALIAGLLLAETEFRRQVEVTIQPFQGLLLGVFLISVGMSLDLVKLAADPLPIVAGLVLLIALKGGIVAALLRAAGRPWGTALHVGLLMGPGGELSLVVIAAAAGAGLLGDALAAQALLIAALGMALIPLVARLAVDVERRTVPTAAPPPSPERRVVIVGFGRVGQLIAAMLTRHKVAWLAVDSDPDTIAAHKGDPNLWFGDAANRAFLARLDLQNARALVVTVDAPRVIEHVVAAARADWPDLQIVARARDADHAARLYRMGVSDAVPETVESSLQLSEAVLVDIGIPMGPVIASIHEKRAELRAEIQAQVPGLEAAPALGRRRLRDAGKA
jgi:CPA2 family monovalent cation:H+ antiporter-2